MAQIFQADAQSSIPGLTLPAGVTTALIETKPLQPPFGTCKAKVFGQATFLPSADWAQINLLLYRNPAKENLLIGTAILSFASPAAGDLILSVAATDDVPDGRSLVYQLAVYPTGSTAGSTDFTSYIEATLISG